MLAQTFYCLFLHSRDIFYQSSIIIKGLSIPFLFQKLFLSLNWLKIDDIFLVPKQSHQSNAIKLRKNCFIEATQYIFCWMM